MYAVGRGVCAQGVRVRGVGRGEMEDGLYVD